MDFKKVKCVHCNKILSIDIRRWQSCECGKVQMDAINPDCIRLLANPEDYKIIDK